MFLNCNNNTCWISSITNILIYNKLFIIDNCIDEKFNIIIKKYNYICENDISNMYIINKEIYDYLFDNNYTKITFGDQGYVDDIINCYTKIFKNIIKTFDCKYLEENKKKIKLESDCDTLIVSNDKLIMMNSNGYCDIKQLILNKKKFTFININYISNHINENIERILISILKNKIIVVRSGLKTFGHFYIIINDGDLFYSINFGRIKKIKFNKRILKNIVYIFR